MLIKSRIRHYAPRAGIIIALQVAFIVAKLTGLITWPWPWVFAPLLITGSILAIVLCVVALLILILDD